MRYHFTATKMAIHKKTNNSKCWWQYGEIGMHIHCWWEQKMVYNQEIWIHMSTHKNPYMNIHSNIIHSSQKVEKTQMSISWWMNKLNVLYPYSAILFGRKMNDPATKDMNESYMHIAKWEKPEKMNTIYCDLNICLPRIHMLRSWPSNVRILVGGAFGRDLKYEGEAPMSRVSLMKKEVGTQEVCVLGRDFIQSCWIQDLRLPASQMWEINFCCL